MYRRLLRRLSSSFPPPRQSSEFDVVIVGAGPAGLSAAIRLKQLEPALSVVVLEKASQIGGHVVSGAVIEPRALDELLPDWRRENEGEKCPLLANPVKRDEMKLLLNNTTSLPLPIPPVMHNSGNFIVSLSEFVRWLGAKAEALGIEIYPGFGGQELVLDEESGKVCGVATNDFGLSRSGEPKENYERGLELRAAKAVLLAEGCHGSLSKQAIAKFNLRANRPHQTYGLGLKEVWELPEDSLAGFEAGKVVHSVGWPLDGRTYGGAFMYHFKGSEGQNLVSVGLVVGLDYANPYLSPYQEFQRLKLHPLFKSVLQHGKCIAYGARALNEGGWQSIPKLNFPGGALIGCSAGFVNVPKIKGTHTAMKSGMLAAEEIIANGTITDDFETRFKESWAGRELWNVRNYRPAFHTFGGLWGGLAYSGVEAFMLRGREPWTLSNDPKPDFATLEPAATCKPIEYPKADGKITFELLESVSRTGTNHEEDQPCHLQLKSGQEPQLKSNLAKFAGPEQLFCPAGVYEYVEDATAGKRFQINAQNCIHCKTCDIKDPSQNINWTVPEGGGGPQYTCT